MCRYVYPVQNLHGSDGFTVSKAAGEIATGHDGLLNEAELAAVAEEKETHSFEIDPSQAGFIVCDIFKLTSQ